MYTHEDSAAPTRTAAVRLLFCPHVVRSDHSEDKGKARSGVSAGEEGDREPRTKERTRGQNQGRREKEKERTERRGNENKGNEKTGG